MLYPVVVDRITAPTKVIGIRQTCVIAAVLAEPGLARCISYEGINLSCRRVLLQAEIILVDTKIHLIGLPSLTLKTLPWEETSR